MILMVFSFLPCAVIIRWLVAEPCRQPCHFGPTPLVSDICNFRSRCVFKRPGLKVPCARGRAAGTAAGNADSERFGPDRNLRASRFAPASSHRYGSSGRFDSAARPQIAGDIAPPLGCVGPGSKARAGPAVPSGRSLVPTAACLFVSCRRVSDLDFTKNNDVDRC